MRIFRIVSICLVIACCVTIFCFSAQNSQNSGKLSGGITEFVISIIYPDFSEFSEPEQAEIIHNTSFIIRKLAHFSIFLLLGFFSYMSIVSYKKPKRALKVTFSSMFCLLYAISDEFHQLFVPGRSGEVRDVCIDFSGAILGIVICLILFSHIAFLKKFIGDKNA